MQNNIAVANILDDFHQHNHSLIFLTSAIRSMFETGNVQDANVDVGIFNYMSELSDGFIQLERNIQQLLVGEECEATSEPNEGLANEHNTEQET